jgi:RNA polymerase sporulation-specific sigma factor
MDQNHVDQQVLWLAKSGDSRAFERLFAPVKPYAKGLAKRFFVSGWEKEDLYQEALAGFAAALLSFEPAKGADFHEFSRMCMRNSVVACVRRATRAKRGGGGEAWLADLEHLQLADSDQHRPDFVVEQQAECSELLASLKSVLSSAEWTVLRAVMAGAPLAEVALEAGVNQRAVENALSRARVKARRLLKAA